MVTAIGAVSGYIGAIYHYVRSGQSLRIFIIVVIFIRCDGCHGTVATAYEGNAGHQVSQVLALT